MTTQDIIKCAAEMGYQFTEEDAQDVIDTKPVWAGVETVRDAVRDYLDAFGG